ncbi:phage tail protein [Rahnella sp. ChDrAdgB13]|uniref:phage tail protein n=1 Tax=Rahnella sp. ChDrAdgB13 TaxID=1850581 RepID=UPI001AD86612|nr:phage tail protein [Rahnella sp. ChDrAdgB13]
MNDLKKQLLSPEFDAFPVTILGAKVFIRRLTSYEVEQYDQKQEQLRTETNLSGMGLSTASLILSALVDEKGMPIPANILPAPDELLKARSNASLIEALQTVQRHSWGTLEEAKKN